MEGDQTMNTQFIQTEKHKYTVTYQANNYGAQVHKLEDNTYIYAGRILIDEESTDEDVKCALEQMERESE